MPPFTGPIGAFAECACRGRGGVPYREGMGSETMMTQRDESANARVLFGLAIVLIGFAMLAQRNDGWGIHLDVRWWPWLLILLGAAKMVVPGEHKGRRRSRRGGFWLFSIGGWGLISEAQLFGFDYSTSWPLLLVAAGINIVWRSVEEPPGRRIQEQ